MRLILSGTATARRRTSTREVKQQPTVSMLKTCGITTLERIQDIPGHSISVILILVRSRRQKVGVAAAARSPPNNGKDTAGRLRRLLRMLEGLLLFMSGRRCKMAVRVATNSRVAMLLLFAKLARLVQLPLQPGHLPIQAATRGARQQLQAQIWNGRCAGEATLANGFRLFHSPLIERTSWRLRLAQHSAGFKARLWPTSCAYHSKQNE